VSKAQLIYRLSIAVLAFAPLAMALKVKFGALGFFDGPRGD
jgi:hypothetical protein